MTTAQGRGHPPYPAESQDFYLLRKTGTQEVTTLIFQEMDARSKTARVETCLICKECLIEKAVVACSIFHNPLHYFVERFPHLLNRLTSKTSTSGSTSPCRRVSNLLFMTTDTFQSFRNLINKLQRTC